MNCLQQAEANALLRLKPPPDLTVSEWADANRRLSSEASAEPGRWFTARAEYQRGIMDAVNDSGIHTVVLMSSAQIGKTEILNNVCGYFIDKDPAPILVVQPNLVMGQAWSKDRLSTMLRDTPCLKGKVNDPRARDSGNTTMHKVFPGGHITVAGSNSPAGLASRPIRILLADELDRWPVSAGTEGDPLKLATKRTATFFNRKIFICSTPTVQGFSRIEDMYEESDQRKFWVPCPHCGEFQILEWAQVQWPDGKPEEACYYCAECGAEINDADKLRLIREGQWRAESESRGVAGFHLSELYSPWRAFGEVACDFMEARREAKKGNLHPMQVWVNTSLGETWDEDPGEEIKAGPLLDRVETFEKVPDWVGVITAGCDTQADRVEASVIGWGKSERSVVLGHKIIYGDPAKDAIWADLDLFLDKNYDHENGHVLPIAATFIDSGGHNSKEVYDYCRPRQLKRIYACKGSSAGEGAPLLKRPSKNNQGRVLLWSIGVHTAKDWIYSRLKDSEAEERPISFNDTLDEEYFLQLTAEKKTTRYHKGHQIREYVQTRKRNEALDCFVYALGALHSLNPNLDKLVDRLQIERKTEEPKPTKPKRGRKSSWASGWR